MRSFYLQYDDDPGNTGFNDGLGRLPKRTQQAPWVLPLAPVSAETMPGIVGLYRRDHCRRVAGSRLHVAGELHFYRPDPAMVLRFIRIEAGLWVGSMKPTAGTCAENSCRSRESRLQLRTRLIINSAAAQVVDASAASLTFTTATFRRERPIPKGGAAGQERSLYRDTDLSRLEMGK